MRITQISELNMNTLFLVGTKTRAHPTPTMNIFKNVGGAIFKIGAESN